MHAPVAPAAFAEAVRALTAARLRSEVQTEEMRAPQRLAPWAYAMALRVVVGEVELAAGRLVLLHDPDGQEAWGGTLRLVGYASTELDSEMLRDPLLPEVGWSWLTDALAECGAQYSAIAGTVTQTASTRFGELAGPDGPGGLQGTGEIEVRASWTPLDANALGRHLRAWAEMMGTAAGLPPPGVTALPSPAAG